MDRDRIETQTLRYLRWLAIVVFLLVTLFPFYYMLVLSVRPIERVLLEPGSLLVPLKELTVSTYQEVLTSRENGGQGFLSFIANSAIVAVSAAVLALVISIPGAYAVSRLRFFGRRKVEFFFLAVYLFPSIVIAIPLFVVFTRAGLRGSLLGLVLVYISQTVPVSVYMLKNYFETIPVSLEESAAIDGAGRLGIIRRISLPLAAPSVMAVALYDFMIAWNEYLFALLFMVDRPNRWTVSLGLAQLADGVEVPKTILMAGSVLLTLPIVLLFFASERLLTEGLTAGAEKG
ncbi:carbohydrate ABC transporter permease [Plantactinospora sp. GCM10030261]|uniref:carbohydrate ABC transporter permease n=1 Tax=Plantactinospora sp. GCM10030261 TaxID=3273420 RepID=UPI00361B9FE3